MSETMKIEKINVFDIKVPSVRITSTWDDEMLAMFKASVKAAGIEDPLKLIKEGEIYWLVDGLHRLEEAKLNGMKTVDCVVRKGKMKEVHLSNLLSNRLRGGTKASEMVSVVTELYRDLNVPIEEIVKKTGLKRDYIDNMLAIGSAHHEVWEALDNEEIGVGHAYQLSRIGDAAVQLRLLHQTRVYKIKIKDLKEIVDEAIELIKNQAKIVHNKEMLPAPQPRLATCQFCSSEQDPRKMAAPIMCMGCYGHLMGEIQQAKVEAEKIAANEAEKLSKDKKEVPVSDTPP